MADHIADPQRLRQLSKDLKRFESELKAEGSRLRSSFARANWLDREGQKFEGQLKELANSLSKNASAADQLSRSASKKAEALEQYLRR